MEGLRHCVGAGRQRGTCPSAGLTAGPDRVRGWDARPHTQLLGPERDLGPDDLSSTNAEPPASGQLACIGPTLTLTHFPSPTVLIKLEQIRKNRSKICML